MGPGIFRPNGAMSRPVFIIGSILLSMANLVVVSAVLQSLGQPLMGANGAGQVVAAWASIPASVAIGVLAGRRCRDAGITPLVAFLTVLPMVSVAAFLIMAIAPGRKFPA